MSRTHVFVLAALLFAGWPPGRVSGEELDRGLIPLVGPWEYLWEDAGYQTAAAADSWLPIVFPSNPPDREGRTAVWYRVTLPEVALADPQVFVYSVDLVFEAYLAEQRIYSFGRWDGRREDTAFLGWPWHLIRLPSDFSGKTLYFRVRSDYRDIGLWGQILLGGGRAQLLRMIRRDSPRVVVALLSLAISGTFLTVYLLGGEDRSSLYLSLVGLALVVRVLSQTHLKQLLLDAPLFWEHVKAASYFAIPALVALFLESVLDERLRRVARVVRNGVLAVMAALLTLSVTGLLPLTATYGFFDAFLIVMLVVLGGLSLKAAARGNAEAKVVAISFVVMGLLALYSILVSRSVLPWSDEIDYLLLFQLSVGLALVLVRRHGDFRRRLVAATDQLELRTAELGTLKEELEKRVGERTEQLERANQKLLEEKIALQITSITDGLTNLYNKTYTLDRLESEVAEARRYGKPLSVLMLDLDQFKRINDSYGHPMGDQVMKKVAATLRRNLRESDLAGRYGGEEFLVILPETECAEAGLVAERIRSQVEALAWNEREVAITLSGGVAQYDDESAEQLLQRADFLLYQAKEAGRNKIFTEQTLGRSAGRES